MKSRILTPVLCAMAISLSLTFSSCNSDDDPPYVAPTTQSFSFDEGSYNLIGFQSITEIKQENVITADGNSYDRSAITIIGMLGFTETATVSFDLYYRDGQSIAGTYTIFEDVDGGEAFDEFISPLQRGCLGWTSMGTIFNTSGGDPVQANNPSGTVTIVADSANNYTIQYTGNYKLYDDALDFVRNVPCSVNVTGDVVIN